MKESAHSMAVEAESCISCNNLNIMSAKANRSKGLLIWDRIFVQVTIYRRLLIGRDGHLDQSEAYDIAQLVREYAPRWAATAVYHCTTIYMYIGGRRSLSYSMLPTKSSNGVLAICWSSLQDSKGWYSIPFSKGIYKK